MNRSPILCAAVAACASLMVSTMTTLAAEPVPDVVTSKLKVKDRVAPPLRTFAPGEVLLLDGPFKRAEDAETGYIMSLEPDRLLAGFRREAGLPKKAEIYGGWEARGVAGHSLGHWLSGMSYVYAMHKDPKVKEKVDYAVAELAEVQKANGDANGAGYLNAFDDGKKIFREVRARDIRTEGFDLNGGWVPFYTIHKVMAGLRDAYLLTGNAQALDVLKRKADWTIDLTKGFNDEDWQKMLRAEHGGMNEVLADLYAITGEKKYEDLSLKFYHKSVLDPLTRREDKLRGLHGNTQIPKLIGLARLYEITGDDKFATAADFFWNTVIDTQSYANGGNTSDEHFGPANDQGKRIGGSTSETCNTYNMLKLAGHLYRWEDDARQQMKLADWAERATYNHILASIDPANGAVIYYAFLGPASKKNWSTPHDSFWCCTGTGMENHARYPHWIYNKGDGVIAVNQYIASEAKWAEQGVTIRQETRFPEEPRTKLTVKTDGGPKSFTMRLRYPSWATSDAKLTVNGKAESIAGKAGTFIDLNREWKDGDSVELALPMALRDEPLAGMPERHAILYGPVLLAGNVPDDKAQNPAFVTTDKPLDQWLAKSGSELMYETKGVGKPADVKLKPYYAITSGAHNVYWDYFTPEQWATREAEYRAEQERVKALEARTTDTFTPGEQQPEVDRGLKTERSRTGENGGRKWRDAFDGGFFEFSLKVDPAARNELILTYFGSDAGGREFDVVVDGKVIATQVLNRDKPDQFFDVTHPLDEALTKGKESVRVRLQAKPGKTAGGMFGVRMVRSE